MKISLSKWDEVTPDKVDYIESEVKKNLDFRFESKSILTEEAKVTLNWLFALTVTPAGYFFSKYEELPWWVALPLVACSLASGLTALYLFHRALHTQDVIPPGNEPKNLVTDNALEGDGMWLRLQEVCNLQERIDVVALQNERAGTAINRARWGIVIISIGSVFLMGFFWIFNELWE